MRFEPSATVLADSVADDSRLTTMEISFHRFILAELNTHRMFSRNGSSSRAIPVKRMIQTAKDLCVEPLEWGANKSGMQAKEALTGDALKYAQQAWNVGRARAIDVAEALAEAGAHKQIVNRVLEPYLPITMVVTGDDRAYDNFFSQRAHPDAQPEMQALAYIMKQAYDTSEPMPLSNGCWHLPYYDRELASLPVDKCVRACVGRCARVSYNNHNGERNYDADVILFHKLVNASPPHLSPLEHVAVVNTEYQGDRGNFSRPWLQFRKTYSD